jgi:hypothetical protein
MVHVTRILKSCSTLGNEEFVNRPGYYLGAQIP